jgi:hypothetical protein
MNHPSWNPIATPTAGGRFELQAPPGKRAVAVSTVHVGDKLEWVAKTSAGPLNLPVVDVVEGQTVELDVRLVKIKQQPTGTLHLAPSQTSNPQPKSKSSSPPDHNDSAK